MLNMWTLGFTEMRVPQILGPSRKAQGSLPFSRDNQVRSVRHSFGADMAMMGNYCRSRLTAILLYSCAIVTAAAAAGNDSNNANNTSKK